MRQVALVTGGAKRIGRAIVLRLAQEGFSVAIHCHRSQAQAQELVDLIEGKGGKAAIVRCDLSDAQDVAQLVRNASQALSPLTLLVNNASEFEEDEVATLTQERWDRHFAVNLRAPVFLARDFALQAPPEIDCSIVNIIDQRVLKPTPQFFSYSLTKSALYDVTKTLAQALAPRIRVNAVGPGPTLSNVRQEAHDFEKQTQSVLLGHGGSPEEIAEAVLFLATSRSITGQMIAVDGGQHLVWQTPDVYGISE